MGAVMEVTLCAMIFSHQLVLSAITTLVQETANRPILYSEIATRVGCSERTVIRAVAKLRNEHKIVVSGGGRGHGYRFEVRS